MAITEMVVGVGVLVMVGTSVASVLGSSVEVAVGGNAVATVGEGVSGKATDKTVGCNLAGIGS